ncbi:diguanylate cyclase/phosphodiesterase with PAS/PAC sensor(s) [Gloeothece citriformis PCC 7424]|uniref:Diguanylate cyclase/phosphodiesterase with PAS/PAC sensor(S) n=1 Tax=Gloeothece citriformis (strain PCC 7424) TaxID=65393 RepID=B7KJT7_GLOC7|nr:EAL domain-containing protein [Gloeothece citriformis]ACK69536.1 diguanylate cyclase/phosphodiesterase with PAS/PAC sensor(s) [Gloeothece citriformis PCC 7424]
MRQNFKPLKIPPYSLAIICPLLALGVRYLLNWALGNNAPLLIFIIPVIITAWYGGLLPGILSTVISAYLGNYFFIHPTEQFKILSLPETVRIIIFLSEGIFLSIFFEYYKRLNTKTSQIVESLRESEERYRLLVEGIEDYGIFMLDGQGRIISWNLGAERIQGYQSTEIIGRHYSIFFTTTDTSAKVPEKILQTALKQGRFKGEGWRRRKDGSLFWASIVLSPVFAQNRQLKGFAKITRDISERKQAEVQKNKLLKDLTDLKLALDQSAIVAVTNSQGIITAVNDQFCQISGYSKEELIGKTHRIINSGYHSKKFFQQLWATISQGKIWRGEICNRSKTGQFYWVATTIVPFLNQNNQPFQYFAIRFDITQRKLAEKRLRHEVLHDSLTGLPNRTLLIQRLEQVRHRAKRKANYCFALLFIDLDRFKNINDNLGHPIGDRVLITIASRLQECVRSLDTVARLGGDEFIILLDELEEEKEIFKIIERIEKQLTTPMVIEGQTLSLTASIGIAFNDTNLSNSDLLRNADLAMYRVKNEGKAGYAIYQSEMYAQAQALWELENHLKLAIERQEFLLYYQPILSLKTLTVIGFEALIRWQHPQRGLISPVHFIPVAEETDLIVAIGEWVLQQSCQQLSAWREKYPQANHLTINVNLSNRQLEKDNFVYKLDNVLQQTGLPATQLKLEITETLLMTNLAAAIATLSQLKQRNINISIDDFGTGYSSLNYLCRLPVSSLKIDRSFVANVHEDSKNLQIIQTILSLGEQLMIEVIAEGIETQKHLEQLQELGCQYGQGYLFSKPVNCEAAEQLICAGLC